MKQGSFSRKQAAAITGLSARQLGYWRRTGLVVPRTFTPGGHARYSFTDLIALRAARRLLEARVSLQRIRKCLESLTRFLPTVQHPLSELSLVVTGDVVLVIHGQHGFDALTGQQWVFPVEELVREAEQLQHAPRQGDLFAADDEMEDCA